MALRRCGRRSRGSVVLIIADDTVAREVYAELFAMRGHAVETVGCARAGLTRLAQRPDIAVIVLALSSLGAMAPLRRRLRALAPRARVHVLGIALPSLYDVAPPARQQLH